MPTVRVPTAASNSPGGERRREEEGKKVCWLEEGQRNAPSVSFDIRSNQQKQFSLTFEDCLFVLRNEEHLKSCAPLPVEGEGAGEGVLDGVFSSVGVGGGEEGGEEDCGGFLAESWGEGRGGRRRGEERGGGERREGEEEKTGC